jgi:hypothetical protein
MSISQKTFVAVLMGQPLREELHFRGRQSMVPTPYRKSSQAHLDQHGGISSQAHALECLGFLIHQESK